MEAVVAVLVLVSSFIGVRLLDRGRRFSLPSLALVSVVAASVAWTATHALRLPAPEEGISDRPIEVPPTGYTTSRSCEACHPAQYQTWHASYHRTMTQVVTPETAAADLDGTELSWAERLYRIERRGDDFYVRTSEGEDPVASSSQRIVLSTGSHSMQVYWMESEPDRQLEMLPFHYLVPEEQWVHRSAAFLVPPNSKFYGSQWNEGCIHCHTTRGQPRMQGTTVDTQVGEFGIACESCHGPGERHVRENRNPVRRYRLHLGDDPDPDIVDPERLDARRASEICGRCHGYGTAGPADKKKFDWDGYTFEPGRELSYSRRMTLGDEVPAALRSRTSTMFWPDGMVRGSGREFGALLESPCFRGGDFSCLSCHTMHQSADDPRPLEVWANDQLGPGMDGNEACASCHPALVSNASEHSHHPPESPGSLCYNCHMPYTTYGLLKAIRSHEISSPSASTGLATGRPNACNQCHLDEPLGWTAEQLQAWYEIPVPEMGIDERNVAASLLWLLSGDAAQRALAAWSMGWEPAREASGTDWIPPYLAQLLEDPYPAVRFVAERSLRRIRGFQDLDYDFIGSEDHQRAAHAEALARWSRSPVRPAGPTLIQEDGRVHPEVFARLLAARDDRPVVVAE
ncbi:MAG: cytochrome c3 family protein [Myxococcota bacterium]